MSADKPSTPTVEPIAIIGMAARLPGAENIEEFWANLLAGRDSITELDDAEILRYHEDARILERPDYVRRRPIFADSDAFDAKLFGMTPREAELRDPQYRAMLETVHAVLEHGGYDPATYPGQVGLFASTNINRYRYDYIEARPEVVESVGHVAIDIHNNPDYLSTYISYKLGLRGPSLTLLTACSSALAAVHLACGAIRASDCEMAVAGGVDIEFPYHRGYVPIKGGIGAHDGVLRAFDAAATGTNFGDGVGAVLLKSLDAALRDGDMIYATVLGSAINNDGSRKVGFTAPSVDGQSECVRRALAVSGVDPGDIGYVEAHGTATNLGDPIELAGLIDAYQRTNPDLPAQYCAIGSVKSNIGHLGQAAGIAALIKTALALSRRTLPGTIHVTTPNPHVDWVTSPFFLNTETVPWPDAPGGTRIAGVSSFGIGGTNAHAIVAEPPAPPEAPESADHGRDTEAVLWSAVDQTAEALLRERLAGHFATLDPRGFADSAHTLRVGRTAQRVRGAVLASDSADAAEALRDPARIRRGDGVARSVVFAFPGQGAQFPGACRGLYDGEPLFRQGCDAAFDVLTPLLDTDLRKLWLTADDPAHLAATDVAQPLLYVWEYTLAHCLRHWGVAPDRLVGHSLGELVAAAVADVFDFESGLRAVAARARAMREMPPGQMLAVPVDEERVADLLHADLVVAARNSARQVVLAGPVEAVRDAIDALAARGLTGRLLDAPHAFHSPAMADASAEFAEALRGMTLHPPAVPVVSAATGEPLGDEQAVDPDFWAGQLVSPVDFDAAAGRVLAGDPVTVLEVGPGRTLAALLRGRPEFRATPIRLLPTVESARARPILEDTLAQLWVDGVPVDYWRQDRSGGYRRVPVPGYPYQRRRYWLDSPPRPATEVATEPVGGAEAATGATAPETAAPATTAPGSTAPGSTAPVPVAAVGPQGSASVPATEVAAEVVEPERPWRLAELEWVPERGVATTPTASTPVGVAVLLVSAGSEPARLALAGLQRAGYRTLPVADRRDPAANRRTAIDPTRPEEWLEMLDRVAERAGGPVLLGYAALLDPAVPGTERDPAQTDPAQTDPAQTDPVRVDPVRVEEYVAVAHAAVRAAATFQRRHRRPTRLVVIGRDLVDVTGAEPVDPARATLGGLLRSAELELPQLRCQLLDVAEATNPTRLGWAVSDGRPLLALRGATVWHPRLRRLPGRPATHRLRPGGTYLVTGGLGGIGLVVARALAETGTGPRLALLGRGGIAHLDEPARARIEAEIEALRDAGAEVAVFTGDVGDPAELDSAVTAVQDRFGSVNGVIHAAGVAGGGLLERRDPEQMRRVLHPKVAGVLAIEQVFAGRAPLDFLLLFSSQAGSIGMYGSADYAAANAYLDAHSRRCVGRDRLTVSVQWPGWGEVGMLARSAPGQEVLGVAQAAGPGAEGAPAADPGGRAAVPSPNGPGEWAAWHTVRTPGRDWEFDEHVFTGTPVLPGTTLLESVVLAAQSAGLYPAGGIELRDTVFLAPVVGDRPRQVRVLLAEVAAVHRFRVQSRADGTDDGWTDHATGTFAAAGPVPEGSPAELAAALPGRENSESAPWIAFGPRWRTATTTAGTEDERWVRLVLPESYHDDFAGHPLHPAILDVAAGVLTDLEPGNRYAPFMYRRLAVFAPLTADVQVHARFVASGGKSPRPIDFDIYDVSSGRLLVAAQFFTMRKVRDTEFRTEPPASPGKVGAQPRTSAGAGAGAAGAPPATSARPGSAGTGGVLLPGDGAAALLDMLGGEAPPPVVVVDLRDAPMSAPGLSWASDESPSASAAPTPAVPAPSGTTPSGTALGGPAPGGPALAESTRGDGATPAAAPPVPTAAAASQPRPAAAAPPAARTTDGDDPALAGLIDLWTAALGVTDLAPDDDFFDLGGNSLAAVQLTRQINAHFGIELDVGAIFDSPSLRALAAEVSAKRQSTISPTGGAPAAGAAR